MSDDLEIIDQRKILGKDFKIYGDLENPLFLAKDIGEWIEHSNSTEMLRGVDENEKLNSTILSAGQRREVTMLTEDGLYEVLFQSRKPIAKEFKKQVKRILREIRRRGIYVTDSVLENMLSSPDFGIRLLSEIKSEREKISILEHKIEEDKPKVAFANALEATKDTIYIGDLAKILKKNGADIGQTRLYEWLRFNGYLMKSFSKNTPTQRYMEMGLLDIKERVFTFPNGDLRISKTPMVTVKGQKYFINLFVKTRAIS
ncbi:phage antirepressor KilAC domain-containing protein [Desulfosporosinus sp. Sb-LF]|uniref:phage antirepressor KilAC domain-containing protein n=1 Tax=Desulfosporosinus sp. Sb-LF TaxID=2560027 RepID=UPI00107F55FB|nr:phage antirepressor KilAC domain-containing protein [Desulfosporosinus sp. Sb-LF]TGE31307.1 phage antirepressor Ant [Desulfosporosinus sp. Sb-LF]